MNAAAAGATWPDSTHEVTPESIAAYARATNDDNERYRAGAQSVASPVWPVVPAFPFFMAAAKELLVDADLRRLLHLSEEHVLRGTIRPGDVLRIEGELESVDEEAGTFSVLVRETNQDGVEVARVRAALLVRGAGRPRAEEARGPSGPPQYEETIGVDEDQTQRYASASGDHNPIHLDRAAARRAGLRGIIVHGMCTMAMGVRAVVNGPAAGDPERVRRVRASFARPVLPGQSLVTRVWAGDGPGLYSFASVNADGAAVLTSAEASLGPAQTRERPNRR